MPATSTSAASVQELDFKSLCLLIRCGCLVSGSCASGQRLAYSFLQIRPRDRHPCCSASTSPCRACIGLSPTSHRALPGAPKKRAVTGLGTALRLTTPGSPPNRAGMFCTKPAYSARSTTVWGVHPIRLTTPKKRRSPIQTARILNKDASETADARHGKNNAAWKLAVPRPNRKQKGVPLQWVRA